MTPITDRILANIRHGTKGIYLGRDERRQFERETHHMLVRHDPHLKTQRPEGALAQYHGVPVYAVDVPSHFGMDNLPTNA